MKLRLLMVPCVIGLLSGCISYGKTGLLVTPIGIAGIHNFGPPKKMQSPDEIERIAKSTERTPEAQDGGG